MSSPVQGIARPDVARVGSGSTKTAAGGEDFLNTLRGAIQQVNQLQTDAQGKVADLLHGQGEDLHSAMIAVEKADLAFQLMMQMRNKIVQAYQEISRMPF